MRLLDLEAEAKAAESRLGAVSRYALLEVAQARPHFARPTGLDAHNRAFFALESYIAELERTTQDAVTRRERERRAGRSLFPHVRVPVVFGARDSLLLRAQDLGLELRALIEEHDPGASVESSGVLAYVAELVRDETPYTVGAWIDEAGGASFSVATSVADSAPSLMLVPETLGETLRVLLLGAVDRNVGDPRFDEMFVVRAELGDDVHALLSPAVRQALVNLSTRSVPTLVLHQGTAELRLPELIRASSLDTSLSILAEIRARVTVGA